MKSTCGHSDAASPFQGFIFFASNPGFRSLRDLHPGLCCAVPSGLRPPGSGGACLLFQHPLRDFGLHPGDRGACLLFRLPLRDFSHQGGGGVCLLFTHPLRDFGHQETEEHACYSDTPFGTSTTRRPRSMPAIPTPPSGLRPPGSGGACLLFRHPLRDFGHQEAEGHACYSDTPFGTSTTRKRRSMPAISARLRDFKQLRRDERTRSAIIVGYG